MTHCPTYNRNGTDKFSSAKLSLQLHKTFQTSHNPNDADLTSLWTSPSGVHTREKICSALAFFVSFYLNQLQPRSNFIITQKFKCASANSNNHFNSFLKLGGEWSEDPELKRSNQSAYILSEGEVRASFRNLNLFVSLR